jgi:hypothetical protein
MNNIICQYISFIPIHLVASITNNIVSFETDADWIPIAADNNLQLRQSSALDSGNIKYNQELNVLSNDYALIDYLCDNQFFVLLLSKPDGKTLLWGDKENPVQCQINKENDNYAIKFIRESIPILK